MRELKTKAVATCCRRSHSISLLMSVVFPVPTSPVRRTKPLRLWIPYVRQARASSVCRVKNKYRGSGFTLNGLARSPKNSLYIDRCYTPTLSWREPPESFDRFQKLPFLPFLPFF